MSPPAKRIPFEASLEDLKLVYRALHADLAKHPELLDAALFEELQRILQREAKAEGVDATDHAAWAAWLGDPKAKGGRKSLLG